jgi:3-oxoacyl-ACP reductase-like protein
MLFLLDIDGVMVPAKSWKSPEFLNDGFPEFSSKATLVLQHLISVEDTVILTTSHKANYSIEEWKSIFNNRGINVEKIKTLPENINNLSRKDEIVNWFYSNNVDEDFVIIDDDKSLNELPPFLKVNLVQTSSHIGLVAEHEEIIKSILQNIPHTSKL